MLVQLCGINSVQSVRQVLTGSRFDKVESDWLSSRFVEKFNEIDIIAGVAQLVEQLICNQPVGGSNPSASSNNPEIERNRGFLFPPSLKLNFELVQRT